MASIQGETKEMTKRDVIEAYKIMIVVEKVNREALFTISHNTKTRGSPDQRNRQ